MSLASLGKITIQFSVVKVDEFGPQAAHDTEGEGFEASM